MDTLQFQRHYHYLVNLGDKNNLPPTTAISKIIVASFEVKSLWHGDSLELKSSYETLWIICDNNYVFLLVVRVLLNKD